MVTFLLVMSSLQGACDVLSFFLQWSTLVPVSWSLCEALLIANTLLWNPVLDMGVLLGLGTLNRGDTCMHTHTHTHTLHTLWKNLLHARL